MKNLLTTQQLKDKYDPDSILKAIENSYVDNLEKLHSSLAKNESPLLKYNSSVQISLLDTNKSDRTELINDISASLKDTIYFMMLSKKERTKVSQRMRSYYTDLIKNYLLRIDLIIEDPEICSPRYDNDPTPKHKGINQIIDILLIIRNDLEPEKAYRDTLSRSSYLTGLQISMGEFFIKLQKLGMTQSDQISLVEHLFDDFKVDWDQGDRENIKISLQQPALETYKMVQQGISKTSNTLYSKKLSDDIIVDTIEHAVLLKKRSRRF